MKLIVIALAVALLLSGCGTEKNICGVHHDTYGLFNKDEAADPNVKYRLVTGNVIWSVVLFETAVAPIYFIGFSLYEPVAEKVPCP